MWKLLIDAVAAGGYMYDLGYCTWEFLTDKEDGLFAKKGGS